MLRHITSRYFKRYSGIVYINTDGEKSSRGSLQPVSFTVGLTFSAVSALSGISRHLRHEIEANI